VEGGRGNDGSGQKAVKNKLEFTHLREAGLRKGKKRMAEGFNHT